LLEQLKFWCTSLMLHIFKWSFDTLTINSGLMSVSKWTKKN
jgi:hypothetical protein